MVMSDSTIEDRVKAIIKEVLAVDESRLNRETNFKEDLGADSLDLVTLVMALEEEFKGSISENEVSGMTTVGQAVDLLSRLSASPSALGR
jgi:acyl carrier protein